MAVQTLLEPLREIAGDVAIAEGPVRVRERRRYGRSRIGGPQPTPVSINQRNAALMANLSEGGMRVQALAQPLERGATLRVEFRLPGSPEKLQIRGVVAWVNDTAEAGIRFAKLSEPLARRLREWRAMKDLGSVAREFMRVAGAWQAALDLMVETTRLLIEASSVAITLIALGKNPICSWADEGLPIRQTVAAPIYQDERIVGHLEISSPALGAFDETDLNALSMLAAVVSEMLRIRAEMLRPRAVVPPGRPRKAKRLATRIVSRIEGMIPTIRVRVVF